MAMKLELLPKGLATGAVLAGVLLMATACVTTSLTSGAAISYSELESIYNPGEVGYAAGGRDLRVVVKGNPFAGAGANEAEVANSVVDAMQGLPGWIVTNFTLEPDDSARELYRVVWLVGVPANTSLYAICGASPGLFGYGAATVENEIEVPPGAGNNVMAAFCRRGQMMSYMVASLGDIGSTEDPRFRSLVRVATRVLFPQRDPNIDGSNDGDFDI